MQVIYALRHVLVHTYSLRLTSFHKCKLNEKLYVDLCILCVCLCVCVCVCMCVCVCVCERERDRIKVKGTYLNNK